MLPSTRKIWTMRMDNEQRGRASADWNDKVGAQDRHRFPPIAAIRCVPGAHSNASTDQGIGENTTASCLARAPITPPASIVSAHSTPGTTHSRHHACTALPRDCRSA